MAYTVSNVKICQKFGPAERCDSPGEPDAVRVLQLALPHRFGYSLPLSTKAFTRISFFALDWKEKRRRLCSHNRISKSVTRVALTPINVTDHRSDVLIVTLLVFTAQSM